MHTDRNIIISLLQATFEHRKALMNNKSGTQQSHLIFNFFVRDPTLMNEEFELNFPGKQSRLLIEWPKIQDAIPRVLKEYNKNAPGNKIVVPDDAKPFFDLLRLLGTRQNGKRKIGNEKRDNFATTWNRVVESHPMNTSPQEIRSLSDNTQPFIISYYSTARSEIVQYCIVLNESVISLDPSKKFIDAFDCLFKTYKIFNLGVPNSVLNFFNFFSEFLYEINAHDTPSNTRVFEKITNLLSHPQEVVQEVQEMQETEQVQENQEAEFDNEN